MITVPLSSLTPDEGNTVRNDSHRPAAPPPALPQLLPTKSTASPLLKLPTKGDPRHGQTPQAPTIAPEKTYNPAGNFSTFHFLLFFVARKNSGICGLRSSPPPETGEMLLCR